MKRLLLLLSLVVIILSATLVLRRIAATTPPTAVPAAPPKNAGPAAALTVPEDPTSKHAHTTASADHAPPAAGLFGEHGPVAIDDIPAGRFREQLLQLKAPARTAALKQLGDLKVPVNDVASLHVDENGKLFYRCEPPASDRIVEEAAAEWREATLDLIEFPGPVPIAAPPILHSKPGAPTVIYLDFNGHIIAGTAWNTSVASYTAKPFDTDNDPKNFSSSEQQAIKDIFLRVAEDFRPFNVNVTTEEPAAFGPKTGRILITESVDTNGVSMPQANAGGVAYLAVFGDPDYSYYSPALVYANKLSKDAAHIAEAASHEMGHNLALSHDGTTTETYYAGHGWYSSETSWAPIMGNSYYCNVTQWSKGEYYKANNPEDDIAIIAGYLGYSGDDHADDVSTPTNLLFNDTVLSGTGVISAGADHDRFSFTLATDQVVSLTAAPFRSGSWWGSGGGNLHLKLELRSESGAVVALPPANPSSTGFGASVALAAGTYYFRVSGIGTGDPLNASPTGYTAYGSMGQYALTGSVTVPVLPTVRDSSGPQVVTVGQAVYFEVGIEGAPSPTYRWQRLAANGGSWSDLTDGATYTGTETTTLRISSTTIAMSGDQFRCVASNVAGTAVGASVSLTVKAALAPAVFGLPPALNIPFGEPLSLYASATGSDPMTYQWKKDGVAIESATWRSLYIWRTSTADGGTYTLTASNSVGTASSDPVVVTIAPPIPPAIGATPPSLVVPLGESSSISVQVAGSEPMAYQWRKNGTIIEGATGSTYYLSTAAVTDAGTYDVVVSNPAGSATSGGVNVSIAPAKAPNIYGLNPIVNVFVGGYFHFGPSVTGTSPVSFQWSKDGASIPGATSSYLLKDNVTTADSGKYVLTATNSAGTTTSVPVAVTVQPALTPAVYGLPPSITIPYGEYLNLYPEVTGTQPITLQWKRNGEAIAGAISRNYSKKVTPADSGEYTLTASNAAGSATSAPISVTVQPAISPTIWGLPPTIIREYGQAIYLSPGVAGTSPMSFQWHLDGKPINGAVYQSLSINETTTENSGNYTLTATNAAGSTTSAVTTVTVNAAVLPVLYGLPGALTVDAGASFELRVSYTGTQPMTFLWKKDGAPLTSGSYSYSKNAATAIDAGLYTVTATNVAGSATSAAVTVSVRAALPPVIYGLPNTLAVKAGERLELDASYAGTLPMTFLWKKDGVALTGGTSDLYQKNLCSMDDSGVYTLSATNVAGSTTSAGVTVTVAAPVAPTVFGLPPFISVRPGDSFQLYPTVEGTNPITYQWQRNGLPITGATSGSYYHYSATNSDSGEYTLVATNSLGSFTSSPVTVTVAAPVAPTIKGLPPTLTVAAGESIYLSASVSGTAPITYRWRKDGTELTNGTSSSWNKSYATAEDGGSYQLTATNEAGTTTSSSVTVVINPPVAPTIYSLPTSVQRTTQESLHLFPSVTGTSPITFQWRKNGVPIADGTSKNLRKSNLTVEDSGDYTLTATNSVGTVVSEPVAVTVRLAVAPKIDQQPTSQTASTGDAISLSVAATGYPAPSYRWRKNGTELYDSSTVSGASTAVLSLKNCQLEDEGNYTVVVTNSVGSVTSSVAVLTVSKSPVNRPPQAAFTLSHQRTIGQTLTITINVGDPDGDFSYANLWVRTPGRGWLAIQADNSTVRSSAVAASHAVTTSAGLHTRSFQLSRDDGIGEYEFALTALDTRGLKAEAPSRKIAVTARRLTPGDLDGDGAADLLLQNLETGERQVWLIRNGQVGAAATLPTVNSRWEVAATADLNADGLLDLVWQNTETGERSIWFMDGTKYHGNATVLSTVAPDWRIAGAADFNGDAQPDLVWQNVQTGERSIWFMQGGTYSGNAVSLSTVSTDWMIVGVGDLDNDGDPDLLWRHMVQGTLSGWLMDGPSFASGLTIATVSVDWDVAEVADVNGDGKLDICWQHRGTGELSVWTMDGTSYHGSAFSLPAPEPGFTAGTSFRRLKAVSPAHVDFSGDRKADVILQHSGNGERAILLLNGVNAESKEQLPVVHADWQIAATADMNADGSPDMIWQNRVTGDRSIWLMDGTVYHGNAVALPHVPAQWKIAAAADFNGDRKPDLLWQNEATGQRAIWHMDGIEFTGSAVDLPGVPVEWMIVGAGDLSGDSKADIVWRNNSTGALTVWVMNGETFSYAVEIATVSLDWQVAQISDFTSDGKLDLLWQHRVTGELSIWALNYMVYSSLAFTLPPVDTGWTAGPAAR